MMIATIMVRSLWIKWCYSYENLNGCLFRRLRMLLRLQPQQSSTEYDVCSFYDNMIRLLYSRFPWKLVYLEFVYIFVKLNNNHDLGFM